MSATLSPSDFLASRTIVPGVSRVVSLSDIRTTTDTWEERRFEMCRGVSYGCKIVYTPHRDILQVGFTDRSAHVRTSSRNDTSRDRLRRTGTERLCDRQPHATRWMDWQRERARGACHAQVSLEDTAPKDDLAISIRTARGAHGEFRVDRGGMETRGAPASSAASLEQLPRSLSMPKT
jgi:hypothetical protein